MSLKSIINGIRKSNVSQELGGNLKKSIPTRSGTIDSKMVNEVRRDIQYAYIKGPDGQGYFVPVDTKQREIGHKAILNRAGFKHVADGNDRHYEQTINDGWNPYSKK